MAAGMSEIGNRGLDVREHWRTPRLTRFTVTIFLKFYSVEMLSVQFASKPPRETLMSSENQRIKAFGFPT